MSDLRWFASHRQDFIKEHLSKNETINRSDIIDKFGVTLVVASKDIGLFKERNPGALEYDLNAKVYRRTKKFKF